MTTNDGPTGDTDRWPGLRRLRSAIEDLGLRQTVLSHPETLANLASFSHPVEDWPVANPFAPLPGMLVVGAESVALVGSQFYSGHFPLGMPTVPYRGYDFQQRPEPLRDAQQAFAEALATGNIVDGPIGVELAFLPAWAADRMRAQGFELVDISDVVVSTRRRKLTPEIDAIRAASRLADVVQEAVLREAQPGISEAELAGLAQSALYREAGRRIPAIMTVTTGPATASGGWEATDRRVEAGDLVITDTSPWYLGAWSDTANTIVVGKPDRETQRIFAAVKGALEYAIELCRPGAVARDIDARVRASLEHMGPTYPHHTGHGIGASWTEPPHITPYEDMRIEEDMVVALEPGVYRPGWGGIRLEHVIWVRSTGNELLSRFEHRLVEP